MAESFIKDPNAVLDYKFDFANTTNGGDKLDWMEANETISTHTVTASTGITVASSSITDSSTSVTVWLSGGTAGQEYTIACLIVTSAARTDERTATIRVQQR